MVKCIAWSWILDCGSGLKARWMLVGREISSLARLMLDAFADGVFVSYWALPAEGGALVTKYHAACS